MSPSQMAEVSTASNNEAAATQSLSLLAVWFAVCCSSNLSTHSSKPQPCSWNGCQIHALVGTEHRNSLPHTLCSDSAPLPCSQQTEDAPALSTCIPGIYRGAAAQGGQRIYSRSAFPVLPSRSRGFIPPDQLGKLPSLPSLPSLLPLVTTPSCWHREH